LIKSIFRVHLRKG